MPSWSDEYLIGVPSIDEQHKLIFGMCDKYLQDLSEGKGEDVFLNFLENLIAYCDAHFGFEEHCMHIHHCRFAEKNKEEHRAFSEAVKKFSERYEANGFNSVDSHLLAQTVQNWLALHICKVDMTLADAVKKNPI